MRALQQVLAAILEDFSGLIGYFRLTPAQARQLARGIAQDIAAYIKANPAAFAEFKRRRRKQQAQQDQQRDSQNLNDEPQTAADSGRPAAER